MKKAVLFALIAVFAAFLLVSCSLFGSLVDPAGESRTEPSDPTTAETEDTVPATESEDPIATDEPTEPESAEPTDEPDTTEAPSEEPTETQPEQTTGSGQPPIDYDVNAHLNSKRVIIDAGHGFADLGCTSKYLGGVYERDICYEMAQLLSEELKDLGYEPVMLRGVDTFPSPAELESAAIELDMFYREDQLIENNIFSAYERTLWANIIHRRDPVALMISLHINALPDYEYIRGTEIYRTVDNGCAAPSAKIAGFIETKLREAFPDINLKSVGYPWSDSYIVTKWTEMPSVLVEMAYSTNPDDAELIMDSEWREKYIGALADAIEGYIETR